MREITEQCYIPLVKFIKNRRKFSLTLSISLSLLEQLDSLNYSPLIKDIKGLIEEGKITLAGTAAYSPLLTRLPREFAERQIILNEFALGYYFGKKGGFEGDPSIMVQNVSGFFSPELAVNEDLLSLVSDLGYEWAIADETSTKNGFGLYNFKATNTKLVVRNSKLSNLISDNKGTDAANILESLSNVNQEFVVALKAETFGYENKEGIEFLGNIVDAFKAKDTYFVTVDEHVERANEVALKDINESTWSTTSESVEKEEVYSKWEAKDNKLQKTLWGLLNKLTESYKFIGSESVETGLEELAIWKGDDLNTIEDENLVKQLALEQLVSKVLCSEQFTLDADSVQPYFDMYLRIAEEMEDEKFLKFVKKSVRQS